ncbi:carbohydrate binding domain-containing protein [Paenibacillus sp. CFBP 13594]|uniref:carbohydrate binding domain-containing protein n=1 Tax=Paenibacillus sp. CFBP 13594 TaxID=2774037 RepID=UPI00177E9DC6|nr:carbohydrate binding domain-containing protein [Paenibacillus sp. CFBP 13594]MBD8837041.1 carbohydrate binding domain-containing protein [Paenibacillus sp. CFBP 13594]
MITFCFFEDGTLQGWTARIGTKNLTVTEKEAHEGKSSMLVANRERSYHGPMFSMKELLQLPKAGIRSTACRSLKRNGILGIRSLEHSSTAMTLLS